MHLFARLGAEQLPKNIPASTKHAALGLSGPSAGVLQRLTEVRHLTSKFFLNLLVLL